MISAATVVTIETTVTSRYRDGIEAFIADAGLAVVLAELRGLPDWTPVLRGPFIERVAGDVHGSAPVAGGTVFLCCGARSVFERLATRVGIERRPGPPDSGVASLSLVLLECTGRRAGRANSS